MNKLTETDLHNIVKETVNKILKETTINEKNQIRNANANNVLPNVEKTQNHIKAAMNCFKKVGQFDDIKGKHNSYYAQIMKLLTTANKYLDRYYWETIEGYEYEINNN